MTSPQLPVLGKRPVYWQITSTRTCRLAIERFL